MHNQQAVYCKVCLVIARTAKNGDLTGDERRCVGREECDDLGDLLGSSSAFERHASDEAGLSVCAAGKPVQHSGFNRTGRDRVERERRMTVLRGPPIW
jgi:hypothetical protein